MPAISPTISKATASNWRRLNSNAESRLTSRANKTRSTRRIAAAGYLRSDKAGQLLRRALESPAAAEEIMRALCIGALRQAGISRRPYVAEFIASLGPTGADCAIRIDEGTFADGGDVLGFIYQSITDEGTRNTRGIYYTPADRAGVLLADVRLRPGETMLDPCCGSGSLLAAVMTDDPTALYGFDTDPVAVMIATTNLLIRFSTHDFRPNIFLRDFLGGQPLPGEPAVFDVIATNPPWGSDRERRYSARYPEIKSRERASMIVRESLRHLAPDGKVCFLLPSSLLTTTTHADVRRLIMEETAISRIHLFSKRFDGVFTDFFAISLQAGSCKAQRYKVTADGTPATEVTLTEADRAAARIPLSAPSALDVSIIGKMEALRQADLSGSLWALGIVTGDNKGKLLPHPAPGAEPIFTGKDIGPLRLKEPQRYIRFRPEEFQQCAKEELYRAPEKLIYKFIAKYPIVAYDERGSLCLNSANIVIPRLEGISARSVAVLLNSALYRFYYLLNFHDIKVLKSSLCRLPFPRLTPQQDTGLARLSPDEADREVFSLFGITDAESRHIFESISRLS